MYADNSRRTRTREPLDEKGVRLVYEDHSNLSIVMRGPDVTIHNWNQRTVYKETVN